MGATAPYGSWASPISPEVVARAGRRLGTAAIADDGAIWWAEGKPGEGGRVVLMRRRAGGEPEVVTPEGFYVRTRVHEYGGGAWRLASPDLVLFANFADQRLYRQSPARSRSRSRPSRRREAGLRYADFRVTPDGATVVCVREVHGSGEAENQIVSLPIDGGAEPTVLAAGRDFYSFPRISRDGGMLAWTCWDHPNMPWDGTELWMASLPIPGSRSSSPAARASRSSSPSGTTRAGCTSPPTATAGGTSTAPAARAIEQITAEQADIGHPQWLFDGSTYALTEDGSIVCVRCEGGEERLFVLDPGAAELRDLGLPFTAFGWPSLSARGNRVAFTASSPTSRGRRSSSSTSPAA